MKSLKFALAVGALLIGSNAAVGQELGAGSVGDQFVEAVQKSDGDKATQLISDHPTVIDSKDGKGDTGLIIAITRSDRDWTGFLLNKGADPNLSGANGDTPLIAAAKSGFDEAAQWLIGLGAKVNGTNRSGETALIIAVEQRDEPLVKILLNAGADPDHADSVAGYSARDYASRDPRARDLLKLIDAKKPKSGSAAAN